MRTTMTLFATALALVAARPRIAHAQRAGYGPPGGGMWIDTTGLGLNADQQAKWKAIREDLEKKNAPLRDQARKIAGGKSMRDLTPEQRESLRPKLQPIMDQMRANARGARDQLEAMLTPEQKAKVEQRFKERMERGGGPPH